MIAFLFWMSIFLILYTYAFYPLLLGLFARFKPKPKFDDETYEPTVTLLIAAYNERQVISKKLENSLELDYPRQKLQILVAADGSNDGTDAIVMTYAHRGIELSYQPERRGKMAAINRAMEAVRGEILLMSDANNMYTPETLRALVAPFADPTVGAVGGAKRVLSGDGSLGDSEGAYWKYESWIKKQETRLGCVTAAAGEANALRRSLYIPPPRDIINDDFYLLMSVIKQGYRAIYTSQAISYERVSASATDEIERRTRMVAGRYQAMSRSGDFLPLNQPQIIWQVVSHKFMRPMVPFFMIFAFLGSVLSLIWPGDSFLTLGFPWNQLFFALQLLFYALAWFGGRFDRKNAGPIGKALYMITFLVNSNFAALQGFFRFLTRQQKTEWKRAQRRGE